MICNDGPWHLVPWPVPRSPWGSLRLGGAEKLQHIKGNLEINSKNATASTDNLTA